MKLRHGEHGSIWRRCPGQLLFPCVPEHSQLQDAVMHKYDTTAPTSLGTACLRTFVVVCLLSPVRLFCDPHGL